MTRIDSPTALTRRKRYIVEAVSRGYDLGTWRGTSRLAGGVLNEVYLAETSRGRFVIRVNRVRRSMAEIERLSTFLSHLRVRGIPVDELVPAADGQVAAEFDGELFSVHQHIQGTVHPSPADLSRSKTESMMTFLAHYHSASCGYRVEGVLAAGDDTLPVMYTDDPDRLRERLKNLPTTDPAVESAVNHAIDRAGSFFASGSYSKLKRTWIHGDFRCCNVAFDADGVSGLFDWDLLCNGPRLFDVAVASADLARTIAGPLSRDPETWWEEFARHLAAYREETRRLGTDMNESEVGSIRYLLLVDAILSGVFFALHLRRLPLKPGESASQRRQRSYRILSESVNDLAAIDSLIASVDSNIFPDP
ncbi:MAG: phosphotransferase [Gemmatimonadota bacterium]|nr:phosphotransferase [Gemmatimonadota bacterium]